MIRESELLGEKANFPSVSFGNLQISLLPYCQVRGVETCFCNSILSHFRDNMC